MRKLAKSASARAARISDARANSTPESIEDDHGMKAVNAPNRAKGGKVSGDKPKKRLDRSVPHRAHGGAVKGRSKGKTIINVVVGQPQDKQPVPVPVPVPGGAPAGAPPMPPPRPAMAPPMAAGPMAGPGGGMPPMGMRKDGGRVYPKMKAGAMGGEGRLEKKAAYGKNARSGEGK